MNKMIHELAVQHLTLDYNGTSNSLTLHGLDKFVELIRAEEREACAKVCESLTPTYVKNGERWLKGDGVNQDVRFKDIAPELEAMWEAEQILKNGSITESYTAYHQCAKEIRARGE